MSHHGGNPSSSRPDTGMCATSSWVMFHVTHDASMADQLHHSSDLASLKKYRNFVKLLDNFNSFDVRESHSNAIGIMLVLQFTFELTCDHVMILLKLFPLLRSYDRSKYFVTSVTNYTIYEYLVLDA